MQQREYGLGLIYLIVGAVGLIGGLSYPLGTFSRMGPGYLPVAISVIILGFAAVSLARGYAKGERARPEFGSDSWRQARSILLLLLAMVVFVAGCRTVGLFPAAVALMFIGAMASVDFRLSPAPLAGMLVLAFGFSFLFTRLLGLPLPLIRMPF